MAKKKRVAGVGGGVSLWLVYAAIEAAGIDYAEAMRRPRWTKQIIIRQIKDAKWAGEDLHWSAVTRGMSCAVRAAFASLQPRLFGRWDRALSAAGLDADGSRRVTDIASGIATRGVWGGRARHSDDEPLVSWGIQQEDCGLHAAAVRHLGGLDHCASLVCIFIWPLCVVGGSGRRTQTIAACQAVQAGAAHDRKKICRDNLALTRRGETSVPSTAARKLAGIRLK